MSRPTLRRFLGFLFTVPRCVGCRRALAAEEALRDHLGADVLCPACRADWEREKLAICPVCGCAALDCRCMPDALRASGAETLIHLGEYRAESAIGRLILHLKDVRSPRAADFAAAQLVPGIRRAVAPLDAGDLRVVYLPRSRRARLAVGHDQAELLARALACRLGAVYLPVIARAKGTADQKTLSADARLANVSGAFRLRRGSDLRGTTVLLVDDIVTSGASMAQGTLLLRKAGAEAVICAAVGLSPRKIAEKREK